MLINNDFIIDLRASTGLSQAKFAKSLGVQQATIGFIESKTRSVPKSVMEAVQRVYGDSICAPLPLPKCSSNVVPIPFYNIAASAGSGTALYGAAEEDILYFDERWLKNILGVNPKNLHLIFASGDSMDSGFHTKEDIRDGDLLMVDTSTLSGNNRIFVIMVNNSELRVKRLIKKLDGTLIVSSNNPKYKQEVYSSTNSNEIEIKVIGKVVWNGSKENI